MGSGLLGRQARECAAAGDTILCLRSARSLKVAADTVVAAAAKRLGSLAVPDAGNNLARQQWLGKPTWPTAHCRNVWCAVHVTAGLTNMIRDLILHDKESYDQSGLPMCSVQL
jgi:hypothetical protein